ncbi:hypothetical protein [Solemya elarraichensis gill symbiont]|uniref:Uncharacterized protein n=1 Tax=Solemya elarraichensis gill symbiont TaxID=1918949 RepID=A0A1T2L5F4_9GAMM|nr:hypothetical protein [Solemya elarraichensis gill symbiont]OOZ40301.1 hypothetical protein BOW52_06040 [Solemya elarraichensis gill symbiont]
MKSKLIFILLTPLLLSACVVGTYYEDDSYGYGTVYPGYTYGYNDYYFYPGIGVYFHIYSGDYFYIHNGHWIRRHSLPRLYHLHHKHRRHIVHQGGKPYHDYDKHKRKYRRDDHHRGDATSDRHERDNIRKDHESSSRKNATLTMATGVVREMQITGAREVHRRLRQTRQGKTSGAVISKKLLAAKSEAREKILLKSAQVVQESITMTKRAIPALTSGEREARSIPKRKREPGQVIATGRINQLIALTSPACAAEILS